MKKILVIGSLNMDAVIESSKIPAVGETVMGKSLSYTPGGKGANQGLAAAKLGGDITFLGQVGDDDFGTAMIDGLKNGGANTKHIVRNTEAPTGMAFICVDTDANNSIIVVPGANYKCDVDFVKSNDALISDCDFMLLQMEIPHETIFYCIERAKELGKTVILNPAPAPKSIEDAVLQNIDYLIPNEGELSTLTGEETDGDLEKKAAKLLSKGVKNLIVTLGEKGVMWAKADGVEYIPARTVEAVDTTAAGDCFCGAFTVALSEGKTVPEAIAFGNKSSSIAVTRKGAQKSLPTREEVDRL